MNRHYKKRARMTIHNFNMLDDQARTEEVSRNAVYLAQRKEGPYDICLYQLYGFYIEVYFSFGMRPEREVLVFSDTRLLNGYLSNIDISGISPCA